MQLPLFDITSNWKPPHEFPNLQTAKRIGIDIETRDPGLTEKGPGFLRGSAEVVGISCATDDRGWYFPFAHRGGGNLDRDKVVRFFSDLLKNPDLWVVGANLQYELEGLNSLGIQIQGKLVDVQLAEPLIYEEAKSYSLETLCQKYLKQGKDETLLKEAADAYGVDPKSGLWQLHSKYVGPYAEFDALATLPILSKQLSELKNQDLLGIFELESKLLPLLWKMRKQGIPVDVDATKSFSKELEQEENALRRDFKKAYGCIIDEWSSNMLASLCKHHKISYPFTEKGNPSFASEFLSRSDEPMLKAVAKIREINRLRKTFVDDWILGNVVNGRIHPQWRQLAGDDGGARTGRMAAANPNPQQVPSRGGYSERLRSLFRWNKWAKLDYSQQEPRLLVHYAYICDLTGAKDIRDAYMQDKSMDIYQFLANSTGMTRRDSKDATLGRCYGMGADKFAGKQGISVEAASEKLAEFDKKVPFVRELSELCMNQASRRGYIKTLLGRRRHFELWEPAYSNGNKALPLNVAKREWLNKNLRRAFTYKALNALIQGSAADMTKSAMLKVYEQTGKVPFMAVHDELNYPVSSEAEARELQKICETCVEIEVPIKADLSYGDHWK